MFSNENLKVYTFLHVRRSSHQALQVGSTEKQPEPYKEVRQGWIWSCVFGFKD